MEAVSGAIFWRHSEFRHVDSGSGEAKSPPCWSEEDWCVFHRPPTQDSRVVSGKSLCRKWLPCASDGRYPYHAKARWTSLDAKNPAARTPEGFQDRVGDVLEQTSNPCHSPETPEWTAGGPCWPSGGAGCSCSSMTDHAGPPQNPIYSSTFPSSCLQLGACTDVRRHHTRVQIAVLRPPLGSVDREVAGAYC